MHINKNKNQKKEDGEMKDMVAVVNDAGETLFVGTYGEVVEYVDTIPFGADDIHVVDLEGPDSCEKK